MRVWTFLLSCLLAVTRGENVAMTSSGTAVFTSERRLFVAMDLPDPLPESDHTNDDAATDDENVTGFPPVDDLTDGARGWPAGFAAAGAVALAFF